MKTPSSRSLGLIAACLAAGVLGGVLVAGAPGWSAAGATAAAAWVAVFVALAAAWIGRNQLVEARQLRLEQAQPHVVAFMEPSSVHPRLINFVVKNFGPTAARDVRIKVSPPPRQSDPDGAPSTDLWLPDVVPVLAPGQRWETFWDEASSRKSDSDLPQRHEVEVEFYDSRSQLLSSSAILDWGQYEHRSWITAYTIHDAAKALRDLQKYVGSMRESIHGGVAVWVRDGHQRDEDLRRRNAESKKAADKVNRRVFPDRYADPAPEPKKDEEPLE